MIFYYFFMFICVSIAGSVENKWAMVPFEHGWDKIPTEVQLNIFENLSCRELVGLTLINKMYYENINETLKETRMLHGNYNRFSYDFRKNHSIKEHIETIKQKTVIDFYPKNNKKTPDDEFFTFCKKIRDAKEIKIHLSANKWDVMLLSHLKETNIDSIYFDSIDRKNLSKINFSQFQKMEISYFSVDGKDKSDEKYFFPIIEKINNSSLECFSIATKGLFEKSCFLYLLKHGSITETLQKYIIESMKKHDWIEITEAGFHNGFFTIDIKKIRNRGTHDRKNIFIFTDKNIDYPKLKTIFESNDKPITLYLYSLSVSEFFQKLKENCNNTFSTFSTLIKNIDEICICINQFNNKNIIICPNDFSDFGHSIELNIEDQLESKKIAIDTESGRYENIKSITFNNSEYLPLDKNPFEGICMYPQGICMYPRGLRLNLNVLLHALTAFCNPESLFFSLKSRVCGGGVGGMEWDEENDCNLWSYLHDYFNNIINDERLEDQERLELIQSKIKKLNSSFRYEANGENKVKILKKIRDIFSTPSNEFTQKQKDLLPIESNDLWDRFRISIIDEINKVVLREESLVKKTDRAIDRTVAVARAKNWSPMLIAVIMTGAVCSPFIAYFIYWICRNNRDSLLSNRLKTKKFWVNQNITFRKLKNMALSNRLSAIQ